MDGYELPEPFGEHFDAAMAAHGRSDDEWMADVRRRVARIRRRRATAAAVIGMLGVLMIVWPAVRRRSRG